MSKFPIDIVSFDNRYENEIIKAIDISNSIQNDFIFQFTNQDFTQKFKLVNLEDIDGNEFIEDVSEIKDSLAGYFPHLVFISGNPLSAGGWTNLFANTNSEKGISIITSNNVEKNIIPEGKMDAYFVYYFTRVLIKLLFSGIYNHEIPSKNGCVFDFMEDKTDILKSMRKNAICDICRKEIRKHERKLSESQYNSIDKLLEKSGELLITERTSKDLKARIFIGSSSEALEIARKIKSGLQHDAHVDTWADGIFDEPGKAYIEILEEALENYEYSIFVFNPDDKIFSRGRESQIPRDNVIFEYGMFLGKHSRKKAFFISPRNTEIKIMSDLLGITCLYYDPTNPNKQSAVSDACDQIRELLKKRQ